MAEKNTVLIYNDEKNLRKYERLNPEQFKTFFMTLFKYKTGDNWEETVSVFDGNAGLQNMLEEYLDKTDANTKKWKRRAEASAKNGPRGGRPRKGETKDDYQARKAKENTPTVGTIPSNEDFENKPVEPTNTPEPIDESAPTPKAPETAPNKAKIPCTISSSEGYSQQNEEIYIETLFRTIWEQRNSELSDIYNQLQRDGDWTTYYHRLKTIMSSYNLQKDVERQVLNKIEAYLKDNYNNQIRTQATA